ncbi:MAG: hypothetical protein WBE34_05095 [Candidatus Nitrosopolaris sp.]
MSKQPCFKKDTAPGKMKRQKKVLVIASIDYSIKRFSKVRHHKVKSQSDAPHAKAISKRGLSIINHNIEKYCYIIYGLLLLRSQNS